MEGEKSGGWAWGLIVLVIVVVGGYFLFKDGGGSSATTDTGPIKLGVLLPLTGDAAQYGEYEQNTINLAVDEINSAGGVNGQQIQTIFQDGKCDSTAAASAAQKLISTDQVQVILGGFCSGETIPIVPIAAQNKVLVFSPGASSPALTNASPYFFRDYPNDLTEGKVLADSAYNKKGWHTVAVLQEQTDYAAGMASAFKKSFEELGGKTTNDSFPTNTSDFRSVLTKIKGQKPDALFIDTQTAAATERVLKQLQTLGWKPTLIVNDVTAGTPATLSTYKTQLEGALTAEFNPDKSNSTFQHLLEAYKAKYSVDLPFQSYMATVYDSVYILKTGIAAVGYNGEKLATWSRTINNWMGASGSVTIGADGDRVSGHVAEIIQNGAPQPLQ